MDSYAMLEKRVHKPTWVAPLSGTCAQGETLDLAGLGFGQSVAAIWPYMIYGPPLGGPVEPDAIDDGVA